MTVSADVTDRASMKRVITEVTQRFGPISGAIHAAGTLHDVLIELRPPDAASEVIDAKMKGALVLDAVLHDADLDFLVLYSSVSSILGLPGQVDYTAANAFLDAFAQQQAAMGRTRVISINWSAWQDVGMAAALSAPTARPGRAVRPGAHPLLERSWENGDDVVFSTELSRTKQWVLAEHVLRGGEALLPGTAYLELARGALAQSSSDARAVEIRDVVFLAPFVVRSRETRELTVKLSRSSHELVVFSVAEATPHMTGKVAFVEPLEATTHDVAAIAARCAVSDVDVDGFLPQSFMDFGSRWKNVRRIRRGRGEALLTLELDPALVDDLARYRLHPALLDMATGGAQALIPAFDPEGHFYAPFSYGRVLVRAGLPARLHSHVRLHEGATQDLAVFDVTLLDESGREIVAITDFVMRRVPDPRAMVSQPSAKTAPTSTVNGHADPASPAWSGSLREAALQQGILPAKGLDAFDRILAHSASPQIVASSIDLTTWTTKVGVDARPAESAAPSASAPGVAFERPSTSTPYVAPRSDIERTLAGYWRELLGVEHIGVNDDFFEVGGQSLVAVRLFNKIRKQYDVDLPLSTLFEAPTIARCAQILHAEMGLESRDSAEPARPAAPVGGAEHATAPRRSRWSSLVPMQPEGTRPPFYCVAGMGGNLANLRRLASLVGSDQPFYGLQPPGLDGKQKRLYRVEELAAHYIEEVLAFQPRGPFLLGGYSGGGVAAFEMTCQLTKLGHEVVFLGFIDSFSPSLPRKSYLARAKIHAGRTVDGGPGYVVDLIGRRFEYQRSEVARRVTRVLGKAFPEKYRYDNIGDSWVIAEHAYAPGTHHGTATLFRAAEESATSLWTAFDVDQQHGWGRFVRGGVDVAVCPGNHSSMCDEPHVQVLAARLRASLERASAVSVTSSVGLAVSTPRGARAPRTEAKAPSA